MRATVVYSLEVVALISRTGGRAGGGQVFIGRDQNRQDYI